MEYLMSCECGRSLTVRAGDAGTEISCSCGKEFQVPPLSVLRQSVIERPEASRNEGWYDGIWIFVVTIALTAIATTQAQVLLIPIGLVTILVGRIWLAVQILREMAAPNALIALCVPFMPTLFFFQRFDITWKPFLYGIMGFVTLVAGMSGG